MKEKKIETAIIAVLAIACVTLAALTLQKQIELKETKRTLVTWQNSGENWMHYSQCRYSVTHTNGN